MTTRRITGVLSATLLATLTGLVGCTPTGPGAGSSTPSVTRATATPSASATPSATSAPVVWVDDEAVALGEQRLGLPADAAIDDQGQGWRRVAFSVDPAVTTGLVFEGPGLEVVSGAFSVDGEAFATRPHATDAQGQPVEAAFVAGERGPQLRLGEAAADVEFLVGERLLGSAEWESQTRILITPTELGRELAPGDPGAAAAWAPAVLGQLEADPRLEGSSVVNQLACHMIGARDKPTWNLETDREDKGLLGFMASRCN